MTVYIILFITIIIFGLGSYLEIKDKDDSIIIDSKAVFFIISIIATTAVEGLRDISVGIDLQAYVHYFDIFKEMDLSAVVLNDFSGIEPGFKVLCKMIGMISPSTQAFIIVTSITIIGLNFGFLGKNSKDIFISVLLFFAFDHFFTSMVSLRQYIAIGIVAWVMPLLNDKRYYSAGIVSLVAFCFHQSAILFAIACVFAYVNSDNRYVLLIIPILTLLLLRYTDTIYAFVIQFFPKYGSNYFLTEQGRIGSLRIVYILLELCIAMLVFFDKKYNNRALVMYGILIEIGIYCGLQASIPWAFRLGYYFDYVLLLMIPYMIDISSNKVLLRLLFIAIGIVFFSYYLTVNPGNTIPYLFYNRY